MNQQEYLIAMLPAYKKSQGEKNLKRFYALNLKVFEALTSEFTQPVLYVTLKLGVGWKGRYERLIAGNRVSLDKCVDRLLDSEILLVADLSSEQVIASFKAEKLREPRFSENQLGIVYVANPELKDFYELLLTDIDSSDEFSVSVKQTVEYQQKYLLGVRERLEREKNLDLCKTCRRRPKAVEEGLCVQCYRGVQ